MRRVEPAVLLSGMRLLFCCLRLLVTDGRCGSSGFHGSAVVCPGWEWKRPRTSAGNNQYLSCLSVASDRTRLCDADPTGQTATQLRLLFLVVVVVLRGTLAAVLAEDLLGKVLCLALLTICGCDVNCVFC